MTKTHPHADLSWSAQAPAADPTACATCGTPWTEVDMVGEGCPGHFAPDPACFCGTKFDPTEGF